MGRQAPLAVQFWKNPHTVTANMRWQACCDGFVGIGVSLNKASGAVITYLGCIRYKMIVLMISLLYWRRLIVKHSLMLWLSYNTTKEIDVERQRLREYLEELNSTIGDLHAPDDDKNKLTGLIAEIELQLNEPMLVTGDPQTLVDQVENMVNTFEQDHPRVSGILNNIMLTLSNMGV
jgi:hypothetical protein